MGSFNNEGRNQGHDSRRSTKGRRRGFLKTEFLEDRVLLATAPYITSLALNNGPQVVGGPRSFFEVGGGPGVAAPPTAIVLNFSAAVTSTNLNNAFQLIRTADDSAAAPDGDFGTLGVGGLGSSGIGFSRVPATVVVLSPTTVALVPTSPLAPDHYRIYLPNAAPTFFNPNSATITDASGNVLDGEMLGNPTAAGGFEDLLPDGTYRAGLSGDGLAGGAFTTGFSVVAQGHVIYARPDSPAGSANGSASSPFPTLNAAFAAAQTASATGPVVILALPSATQPQLTYVLQGSPDGSVSVPFNTTLAFAAGSTVKLANASLFVQNQGSSLQTLGIPTNPVTFTSLNDDTVGGDTNQDGSGTSPRGGDWGGIVFRNFSNSSHPTATFPVDGTLKGPSNSLAVSGADDTLS